MFHKFSIFLEKERIKTIWTQGFIWMYLEEGGFYIIHGEKYKEKGILRLGNSFGDIIENFGNFGGGGICEGEKVLKEATHMILHIS